MEFKATKLYSVLTSTCPRCHQGDFFETRNPYNLKKFDKMHKKCAVCNQDFEMETGFYYGDMYASYGLTVGFGIVLFVIWKYFLGLDELQFLWVFPIVLVVLTPLFYRVARLSWINFFVKYTPLK